MKNDYKPIFSIEDNVYISQHILSIVIGISGLLLMWVFDVGESLDLSQGHIINRYSATGIVVISTIISMIKVSTYKKQDKRIVFYKNKVVKIDIENMESIQNIQEIYKRPLAYSSNNQVKRMNIWRSILIIVLVPFLLCVVLLWYVATWIFYRKFITRYSLRLIENEEAISIMPKTQEEQEQIEEYFKKYRNIDIGNLKTTWFIPEIKKEK